MLYGDSQNILLNIKLLFDAMFLRDGHFKNVTRGLTIRSVDVSKLVRDPSSDSEFAGVSGAQVWQSPYKEWVYESGITLNDSPYLSGLAVPTVPSGIWVNNIFFPNTSGAVSGASFEIDYINGRVIFTGAGIPTNSFVQANYAYRLFRVAFEDKYAKADIEYHAQTELKDNPFTNLNEAYPSGSEVGTLPAIFLGLGEDDRTAYELGNRSAIVSKPVFCHVYAYSTLERDAALDLIGSRWHIHMPLIDFNYAPLPLSGLASTLSPEYIPFQTLLNNVQHNGNNVISKHYLFDSIRTRPEDSFFKLDRGIAEIITKIYNIAPTGRIPNSPYI